MRPDHGLSSPEPKKKDQKGVWSPNKFVSYIRYIICGYGPPINLNGCTWARKQMPEEGIAISTDGQNLIKLVSTLSRSRGKSWKNQLQPRLGPKSAQPSISSPVWPIPSSGPITCLKKMEKSKPH